MTTFMRRYQLARARITLSPVEGFKPVRIALGEIAGKALRRGTYESPPVAGVGDDAVSAEIRLPGMGMMGAAPKIYLEFRDGIYSGAVNGLTFIGGRPAVARMEGAVSFASADGLLDWLAEQLAPYDIVEPAAPGPQLS